MPLLGVGLPWHSIALVDKIILLLLIAPAVSWFDQGELPTQGSEKM